MAALLWCAAQGIKVTVIESFRYDEFAARGEPYLVEFFGPMIGQAQAQNSEVNAEQERAGQFIGRINQVVRPATLEDLRRYIAEGSPVICNVNSAQLNGHPGYQGHFVLIVDVNSDSVVVHDPGNPHRPNRVLPIEQFVDSWASPSKNAQNAIVLG